MNLLEVRLDRLFSILGTDAENGLTAEQVLRNRREFGENLCFEKKNTPPDLLKKIFGDVMTVFFLLLTLFDYLENRNPVSLFAMLVVVLLYVGFVFGTHAYVSDTKKRLDRFAHIRYHVRRSGRVMSVDKSELVPGDLLLLEKGDVMPCDGIILKHSALKILEASVTGRRIPVFKRSHGEVEEEESGYPYFECILFAGSVILHGSARVFVCNTGRDIFDNENFTVSRQNTTVPRIYETAMELKKQISLIWILSAFLLFTVGVFAGESIFRALLYSVATVIAAFPDALECLCDLAIAYMSRRLSDEGVVLRNPGAVDRLGDANSIFVNSSEYLIYSHPVAGVYYAGEEAFDFRQNPRDAKELLINLILSQNSRGYYRDKKDEWRSEKAILAAAASLGLQKKALDQAYLHINSYDFDPRFGFASALVLKDGSYRLIVRGDPARVAACCSEIRTRGETKPLNDAGKDAIRASARHLAGMCERMYAVATLDLSSPSTGDQRHLCRGMVFLGVFGISKPISAAAANAVNICQKSGIQTYLLTDDYPETVFALSKSVSIIRPEDYQYALSYQSYERMDRGIFVADLERYKAYCSFPAEEKQSIVKYHKDNGNITMSLTGGLYDTLPQMESDISMVGIEEKQSAVLLNADLLVKEKRFELVPFCINWARIFYRNVVHLMQYVLQYQFALGFLMLIGLIATRNIPLPLIPTLLVGIGVSIPCGINIFHRKPGPRLEDNVEVLKDDRLASLRALIINPLLTGVTQALSVLISMRIAKYASGSDELASSAALLTFALASFLMSLSLKFDSPLWKRWRALGSSEGFTLALCVVVLLLVTISPMVSLWQASGALLRFWPCFFAILLSLVPFGLNEWMKVLKKDNSAPRA